MAHPGPRSLLIRVLAALMALCGVVLGAGGAWLIALGGSGYYLVAAAGLLLTAALLTRQQPAAQTTYALLLAGTLAWSLWEAGLDWWPLAARLDVLFVLGLLLWWPGVTRRLQAGGDSGAAWTSSQGAQGRRPAWSARLLGGAVGLCALVAVASAFHDPHDLGGALPPPHAALAGGSSEPAVPEGEWHAYGRTAWGQRFSPLAQITPANVEQLQVAWHYRTGDVRGEPGDPVETTYEVTPLKIGNRLFLCTPHQSVIALDATSGTEIWRFEAKLPARMALQHLTCRGLSYQPPVDAGSSAAGTAAAGSDHTAPSPAMAAAPVDAAASSTVSPAEASAAVSAAVSAVSQVPNAPTAAAVATAASTAPGACNNGKLFMPTADGRLLALSPDTGAPCAAFGGGKGYVDLWAHMPNARPGAYYSTSPVVVTRKLVIVGGTVLDNVSVKEQSGVIRAFDINTGALVWNWDSGRPDDTAPLAPGQTYTANSPNSWSISSVDEALGMVYVPLGNQPPDQWGGQRSPAVERFSSSVVALDLATGQVRWNFQTVHHDLWDYDVPSQPTLIDLNLNGRRVPALVQPTKQGEIFVLDRRSGRPVLPVSEMAAPQGAAPGDHTAPTQPRSALSFDPPPLSGREMWGVTVFDQLACRIQFHRLRYDGRFTPPTVQGSLIYPGNFGVFNWGGVAVDPQRQVAFTTPATLAFVSRLVPRPDDSALLVQGGEKPANGLPALNENFGAPYAVKLSPFTSPLGIPCQEPPWGMVAGADLTTGLVAWKHRNGTVRDLSPLALPFRMGVPSLGGPLMTAGGVAFLSGTLDNYVRAYEVSDGKVLWEGRLPAGGQATPMTYTGGDGRQYLLVVAGGHGSTGTRAGDHVIAYALPRAP